MRKLLMQMQWKSVAVALIALEPQASPTLLCDHVPVLSVALVASGVPLTVKLTLARPLIASAAVPLTVIDESLVDYDALLLAREQGYTGVALKACKGHTEALFAAAACAALSAPGTKSQLRRATGHLPGAPRSCCTGNHGPCKMVSPSPFMRMVLHRSAHRCLPCSANVRAFSRRVVSWWGVRCSWSGARPIRWCNRFLDISPTKSARHYSSADIPTSRSFFVAASPALEAGSRRWWTRSMEQRDHPAIIHDPRSQRPKDFSSLSLWEPCAGRLSYRPSCSWRSAQRQASRTRFCRMR